MKTKIPNIIIGLDLGDKKHAICVLNKAGGIIDERSKSYVSKLILKPSLCSRSRELAPSPR